MRRPLRRNKFYGWLITLILLVSLDCALAESTSLAWDASPDSHVAGYNIYYGTTSGDYTNKVTVQNVTTATISNLVAGQTYYFAVTAFVANGMESDFSNEIQFIVPGVIALSRGANPGDPMLIKFPVAPAHWYELQATTDLQNWSTVWQTGVATSNAWVQFSDPASDPAPRLVGALPARFYRLVLH
jgi:hypothetical protein